MKTFLRMLGFIAVGLFVSFIVAQAITLLMMLSFPAEVYERAAQGERAASLQAALQAERLNSVSNIILWPFSLGIAYGLERGWRAWRRQSTIRTSKGVRRLGAAALGLIAALTIHGVYTLVLVQSVPEQYLAQPENYGRELADFGQQLEGRVWIFLITWVVVGILSGSLSGRTSPAQSDPPSNLQLPRKLKPNIASSEAKSHGEQVGISPVVDQKMASATPGQVEEKSTPTIPPTPTGETKRCSKCGKDNRRRNQFCIACGTSLAGAEAIEASSPKRAAGDTAATPKA